MRDFVIDAIFGVSAADLPAVQAAAEARRVASDAADCAAARALAIQAASELAWVPGAVWTPAMYYNNPAAIASVDGVLVKAEPGREWGYYAADRDAVVLL